MFAAGGIMWVNVNSIKEASVEFRGIGYKNSINSVRTTYYTRAFGWPLPAFIDNTDNEKNLTLILNGENLDGHNNAQNISYLNSNTSIVNTISPRGKFNVENFSYKNRFRNTAINVATGLAILFAVWFVCEYQIRRSAARKKARNP